MATKFEYVVHPAVLNKINLQAQFKIINHIILNQLINKKLMEAAALTKKIGIYISEEEIINNPLIKGDHYEELIHEEWEYLMKFLVDEFPKPYKAWFTETGISVEIDLNEVAEIAD